MRILLLTQRFPFGTGEEFLEGELQVIARFAEHITIVPHLADPLSPMRRVPDNVTVCGHLSVLIRQEGRLLLQNPTALYRALSFMDAKDLVANYLRIRPRNIRGIMDRRALAEAIMRVVQREIPLAGIDAVYSYWLTEAALAATLMKKRHPHLVTVARCHGYDLFSERHGATLLPYQREMVARLDAVHPCSRQGEAYLRRKTASARNAVRARYLGVAPAPCMPGSSDGVLRIVSCARLVPLKRIHLLAEALMLVERRVEWTHIGDGPEESRLCRAAETLPPNIRFHRTGRLSHRDVLQYYRDHPVDVFVNVSETEALPVSIMEAMAHGIPCIATDVGGVAEIVHRGNGVLLPKEFSPSQAAEVIRQWDMHDAKRRRAAWRTQRVFFNHDVNYRTFMEQLTAQCAASSRSFPSALR